MRPSRSQRKLRSSLVLVATVAVIAACTPLSPRSGSETGRPQAAALELVWPAPPHQARIAYVDDLVAATRPSRKKSFARRIGTWIGVVSDEPLVRPTGIAASDELLAIADPGIPALFLFDRKAARWRRITKGSHGPLVSPVGVAIAGSGVVYVSDSASACICSYDSSGRLLAIWQGSGLRRPSGLAFDDVSERLYVVDAAAHVIVAYDTSGEPLFSFGGRGGGDGEFNWPSHIHLDDRGFLYVVDSLNFRVQIFDAEGEFVSSFGRAGDGSGDLSRPKGIAVDSRGHVYLVDALFDTVQIFDRDGRFLLAFGNRGTGPGQFWLPTGIAIDADDRVYVADSYNQRVQVFQFLREREQTRTSTDG